MARQNNQGFSTVKTEGLLLPPELITRVADLDTKLPAIRPEDYHLAKGERINEATNRAWNRLTTLWARFRKELEALPQGEAATGPTRERWLLPLFQELGYGRLQRHAAFEIEGKSYAISHLWGHAPIHLVGAGLDLDKRAPGKAGAAQASPHGLVQQFLNRTDDHLWAFLSNGLKLRILRDNLSLTRQAYVEFDLAAMMDGELYSDFRLLWLLCHQSRVESERPEHCWLEKWAQEAREQGARALEHLREGVETAISALGSGFLAHPSNTALQARLASGELESQDYYRQLLRLVYRLIFLFVAEDRSLLLTGDDEAAKRRYGDYYSTARLRRIAHRLKGGRHEDLYEGLKVVIVRLHDQGCPELALPALGSFLWDPDKLPDLSAAHIRNRDFLEAIRALAFVQQERTLRPIDYRNLGPEELGSVYESLLELHPELHRVAATFELKVASGSERKTTGSYYTPESLIEELLNSALDPVLDRVASQPDSEQAILNLKVCDPAVGSGHFLVAAAHRIARRLAAARSGDEEPVPSDITLALRDVVSHCLYGVDINEMAVELCKVSLWMTAMAPGRPLSFLDHRIRCGNSLLGTTPALIANGIPDEAFKPITGDDKEVCKEYKKQNKRERESAMGDLFRQGESSLPVHCKLSDAVRRISRIEDRDITGVREQAAVYSDVIESDECRHGYLVANAWCAAFVWTKSAVANLPYPITDAEYRRLERSPDKCHDWMRIEIQRLSLQYQFFHWHLEFPNVFSTPTEGQQPGDKLTGWRGGFDVLLGNPPWEMPEVDDRQFFAFGRPSIAEEQSAQRRRRKIGALRTDDPLLFQQWESHLRAHQGERSFYSLSGRYPNAGVGRLNYYKLFLESSWSNVNPAGRLGMIVPSVLTTNSYERPLWHSFVKGRNIASVFDFENRLGLFPHVHKSAKFMALTLSRQTQPRFQTGCWLTDVTEIGATDRIVELSLNDLEKFSPGDLALPQFRSKKDLNLLARATIENNCLSTHEDWAYTPRLMFSSSDASFQPVDQKTIESSTLTNQNRRICLNGDVLVPVIEGKMVGIFDHRQADIYVNPANRARRAQERTILDSDKKNPNRFAIPQHWLTETSVRNRRYGKAQKDWEVVFCDVTSATNERTALACIIPLAGLTRSLPAIYLNTAQAVDAALLVGALSAYVVDFFARLKVSTNHLTQGILASLPVPSIEKIRDFSCEAFEDFRWFEWRVVELSYTACDLQAFAEDYGYFGPPFHWDENRRFLIRCELDAAFFHLYCVKRDDVDYIMETFPAVKRKDIEKYGDYRTQLVILDIFDKIKTAMDAGEPYRTLLDPPPGDPRAAHKS